MIREEGIGVYIISNTSSEIRHPLMFKVFDTFLGAPARDWSGEMLALQREADAREEGQGRAGGPPRVEGTKPSLALDRYAGTFMDPDSLYAPITITSEHGNAPLSPGHDPGGHARALAIRHVPGGLGRLVARPVDDHVHGGA